MFKVYLLKLPHRPPKGHLCHIFKTIYVSINWNVKVYLVKLQHRPPKDFYVRYLKVSINWNVKKTCEITTGAFQGTPLLYKCTLHSILLKCD